MAFPVFLYHMKRTEIATLGEFGLIDHLTKDIKTKQETTVKGVGDDAAICGQCGKTYCL